MINPAAKFESTMEMFNAGILCKCDNWEEVGSDGEVTDMELIHEENCEGIEKIKKMLDGDNHD